MGLFLLAGERLKQQLLEQGRIIRKLIRQRKHGPDYTATRHVAWGQNLMSAVASEISTVEQPV